MRLLRRDSNGHLNIVKYVDGEDVIPPYAILSHTWGSDAEEVSFDDLIQDTGRGKMGYKKIWLCCEQARQDGLHHFWVDTCCIDKSDKVELSHAINSMFRWYRNAIKCYVYLSDVCNASSSFIEEREILGSLDAYLRNSKWFTRGWTLQELLAPSSVEFFTKEWLKIGDKSSLEQQVHDITGIPKSALQGAALSHFSINERLSWNEHRQTKYAEDKAYSLLGIFGVFITPIYGEGMSGAFERLHVEIEKMGKCVQDLHVTNPRDDKKRIEDTKGGLLKDSYSWILENTEFLQWRNLQSPLLWIRGDPGKGKTMLLCGIINELSKEKRGNVSFFFCQATDSRINNATAVLRGLLYMLVDQQPSLVAHVRQKYDHAGKTLFEDANAWFALVEIFRAVLQDPGLSRTYLIIDALDECMADLPKLLKFIIQHLISLRVSWIVSSRNWPMIEEQLDQAKHTLKLSLELNVKSVSTAVSIFINKKVRQLALAKKYNGEIQDAVLSHLLSNANNTFLWVALVCQNLEGVPRRNVLKKLDTFPPGLGSLYKRMMQQINTSDDAAICKKILALSTIVYRPLTLDELISLVETLDDMADDIESILEIIGLCGSFLTIREGSVYFVHQSAKDFLFTEAFSELFPSGSGHTHRKTFLRSLEILHRTLRRDIYGLEAPGYIIDDVVSPTPDPLAASRYSCVYWADHLCESYKSNPTSERNSKAISFQHVDAVDSFMRQKYLYWLEALSLCKSMPTGVVSMTKLWLLVQKMGNTPELSEITHDARRFIMSHKGAIEISPLQAYVSAFLFSPSKSVIKNLFLHEAPNWIKLQSEVGDSWSACLQTLEGHTRNVRSVVFSHDSAQVASASVDNTIKIWNTSNGTCLQTLKGHSDSVRSVAFSSDSTQIVSASRDGTIKIWNPISGKCVKTLRGRAEAVIFVVFSPNSAYIASLSAKRILSIWDANDGACLRTLPTDTRWLSSAVFSHDSSQIVSVSGDSVISIWDVSSGLRLQTFTRINGEIRSITFSHDSTKLISVSKDCMINFWDIDSGKRLQTFENHNNHTRVVAFSYDSTLMASSSSYRDIKIWNLKNGVLWKTMNSNGFVHSLAFSHNSGQLASASDTNVKIWDVHSEVCTETYESLGSHGSPLMRVAFSPDSSLLVSLCQDTLKIWNSQNKACKWTFEDDRIIPSSLAFSYDSAQLAMATLEGVIIIRGVNSGECLKTFTAHTDSVYSLVFSHDSTRLLSSSKDKTIKIWNVADGACLQTLIDHSASISTAIFSHDSTKIASGSGDFTLKIWDTSSGKCLKSIECHGYNVADLAFSHNSTQLASVSEDDVVKFWDVSSGMCLRTVYIGNGLQVTPFDFSKFSVYIDLCSMAPSGSETFSSNVADSSRPQSLAACLSLDTSWITFGCKRVLWVPPEYRALCSSVSGNKIAIGDASGRVWTCQLDLE